MPRPDSKHAPFTRPPGEYPRDTLDIGWAVAQATTGRRVVADRWMPEVINVVSKDVPGNPSIRLRLEVINDVPTCTIVEISHAASAGVRQVDLQTLNLAEIVSDVFSAMSWPVVIGPDGETIVLAVGGGASDRRIARRNIDGQRRRKITPELLKKVAEAYAEHETDKPIVKIAAMFGVQERMAAVYVRKARDAGYLAEPKRKKGAKS